MNKNMKKGTLVLEYKENHLYAFHIVLNVKDNKFKRLEFTRGNNFNSIAIYNHNVNFFQIHGKNFNYKYINKE